MRFVFITLLLSISGQKGLKLDYCNPETFNPQCSDGKLVVMESATFGLMRLGRCVDESYGFLGCSADILGQIDQECSGKTSCETAVATIRTEPNCTIPKTFAQYLEAEFSCVKVSPIAEKRCEIHLKSGQQNVASSSLADTQCGDETRPLVVSAKAGQKINVTLTDFNWNGVHSNIQGCVHRYGYFIDDDTVVNICGKTKRKKHLFLSEASSIQMAIDKSNLQDVSFILSLEVIGCPKFEPPKDTWTKEDNGVVTVGCVHSDNTWRMRCIGNHWIGIQGKCEKVMLEEDKEEVVDIDSSLVFGLPPVVGFALIGGLFLVIICVVVTTVIGFFCIKRNKAEGNECYLTPMTEANDHKLCLGVYPQYRTVNRDERPQNQTLLHEQHPQYFVLEKADGPKDPVYDAVYQNIGDGMNSV